MPFTIHHPLSTSRERGAVLVFVLVVALGLVTITIYFAQAVMLEYRAGDNSIAGMEAAQASDAARRYVIALLDKQEEPGTLPEATAYKSEAVPVGNAEFWLVGRPTDLAAASEQPTYGLVDESSKLNINIATPAMLAALPNMTAELAAAIVDWRDADEEPLTDGAEAEAYALLDPSYSPKNLPFESVEELRWIRDLDSTILYGEDTNRNGVLDPNENDGDETPPSDNQDGKLDVGLAEYVTVWSKEPNKRSDGSARINIANAQSQQALRDLLTTTFGQSRGQQITQAAGTQPLRSPLEFYIRSQMTKDEFAQVEDAICTSDDTYTTGLVNVSTASEAVLACLPGIGTERASALVASRQGRSVEELKSIAWVADALDREYAIQAGPYLTARSYQVSADVVAVGHAKKGMHRDLYIVDTADGEGRVVYHRDLSRGGWPLGQAARQKTEQTQSP